MCNEYLEQEYDLLNQSNEEMYEDEEYYGQRDSSPNIKLKPKYQDSQGDEQGFDSNYEEEYENPEEQQQQ